MVDPENFGLLDSILYVAKSLTTDLSSLNELKELIELNIQDIDTGQSIAEQEVKITHQITPEMSLSSIYALLKVIKQMVNKSEIPINNPINNPEITNIYPKSAVVKNEIQELKELKEDQRGNRTKLNFNLATTSYDALCIEAGGIKGIYFLGALHELVLQNPNIFANTTHYIGSSIGSVICYLLCIGYEPIEFFTTICQPNFSSRFMEINFLNLPRILGLFPTSIIKEKLQELTMIKLGYQPTFKDLLQKFGKHLIVPVYKLSATIPSKRKMYFCVDNAPDMIALDAIVLSCSLPIIFQRSKYKDDVYLDGAYTANLPLRHINNILPSEAKILALAVESNNGKTDSLVGYITDLLYIPLREQDNIPDSERCDIIDLRADVIASSINFSIPTKKKIDTFISGMNQIKNLINQEIINDALDHVSQPLVLAPPEINTKTKIE